MAALAASRQSSPASAAADRVPLAALLSLALHGGVAAAVAAWGLPPIDGPPALIVEFVAPAPVAAEAAPAPATAPAAAVPSPAPAEPQPELLPAVEAPLPIPMTKPTRPLRRSPQPIAKPAERPAPSSIQAASIQAASIQAAASAEMAAPAEQVVPAQQTASQIAAPAATPAAAAPAEPLVTTDARFRRPPRPPAYPPRAIALEQEGISVIRALIDTDGSSREVRLWRSSGFALLDQAALAAVRDWAFEAARRGEQPVLAWVEVPVRFEIR